MQRFWRTTWGLAVLLLLVILGGFGVVWLLLVLLPPFARFFAQQQIETNTFANPFAPLPFDFTTTRTIGPPLWMQIAPQLTLAVVGFIGGIVALWQFHRTHVQKDEQFARETLEKQFVDIQNRMADATSVPVRANAAARLVEFATKADPADPAAFPFFAPAVSLLVKSLLLEPEPTLRDSAVDALARLNDFARMDKATLTPRNFHRYEILLRELTDANKRAREAFCRALAEYVTIANIALPERTDDNVRWDIPTIRTVGNKDALTARCLEMRLLAGNAVDHFGGGATDVARWLQRARARYGGERQAARRLASLRSQARAEDRCCVQKSTSTRLS